jgi:hypothetical protein
MNALLLVLALAADAPTTTTLEPPPAPPTEAPSPVATAPKIYVVKPALSGLPPSLAATIVSTMAQAIAREGFGVLTADDVKTLVDQQADLALLGGDADPLALSALATAVGADMLVAAVVSSVDGDTVVQTRLIDPRRSAVLARRELKASENHDEVLPTIESAARLVLQPLLADGRASIAVVVSEEGANVVVDGDVVGVTPLDAPVGLSGGIHQIVISKEGFVRSQETVRVKSGDALTRDIVLRPSVEYLTKYNADAGLYRTLAWVSTAGAVVSVAATGATLAGYLGAVADADAVAIAAQAEIDKKQLSNESERFQELNTERTEARNASIPWMGGLIASSVAAGVTTIFATYFWAFGDDPGRYADLDAPAE